ncbi:hypothetical protein Z043_113377, partial [Scleropages formosus]
MESRKWETLYSKSIVQTLVQLTNKVEDILKRSFNGLLKETRKEQVYSYIIAGGDKCVKEKSMSYTLEYPVVSRDVMDRIRMYEQVHKITYSQSEMIASLVQQAGDSLRKEGHVYYVGWSTLGIMGIIDASECIPTFGAELDTVIFLFTQDDGLCEIETLANRTKQRTSNLHAISHDLLGSEDLTMLRSAFASVLNITWTTENYAHKKVMQELSTKWILNALSTGGHILKGKIFRNYMMDLKVTNSKLFKRAVNILQ